MKKTELSCLRSIGLSILVSLLAACTSTRATAPTAETAEPGSALPPTAWPTATRATQTSTPSLLPGTAFPAPTLTGEATLATPPLVHYSNPVLGFAVDHPADWEVTALAERGDPLARVWSAIEFRSNLYGYGEQVFGRYVVTVAVGDSEGRSLTDTVEYAHSPIMPSVREEIESTCCLTVGGEPAMELHLPWPMGGRWGSRQIVVIHDGREYWLTFYPQRTLDGVTPSDAAARAAFDAFLRTFTFIPVTATATPSRPTVTPVPTPTAGLGDGASIGSHQI
jgi:hypothetical protein